MKPGGGLEEYNSQKVKIAYRTEDKINFQNKEGAIVSWNIVFVELVEQKAEGPVVETDGESMMQEHRQMRLSRSRANKPVEPLERKPSIE